MRMHSIPYYVTISVLLSINVPYSIAFQSNNININERPQQQQQYTIHDVTAVPKLQYPRSSPTSLHLLPRHNHHHTTSLLPSSLSTLHHISHRKKPRHDATSLSLSPTSLLSSLSTPLASASVLALVIVIHEAGHFLAARSFGISVSEFSVGVGPKIAGFRRRAAGGKPESEAEDGDYIDFNLRAVPFGGYVRFPENYNRTLVLRMEDEKRKERQRLRREGKEGQTDNATTKTSNIGGAIRNIFGMKKTTPPPPPPPPKLNPLTQWFRRRTTPAPPPQPLPTTIEYSTDPNLLQNRPWTQRAVVLVGGIVFNLLLAFSCYFGELTVVGRGYPRPVLDAGAVVATVPRGDGASAGVLERGDVILAVNGEKLTLSNTHSLPAAQSSITNLISTIRSTPPGSSLSLTILPSSSSSTTTPPTPRNVIVTPRQVIIDPSTGQQYTSIGVTLAPHLLRTEFIHPTSLPSALLLSSQILYDTTTQTASSLYSFLGSTLSGTTTLSSGVSGPIGVLKMGTDVISTNDATAIIAFIAAISVNLAVVNALPFPGLDGGQLVFVLGEAVSGRKVDQRVQEEINAYALLLLLIVSLSTTVGDVGNLMRSGGG